MSTKCGGYKTPKTPTDESKDILKKNFDKIVSLHENFNNLDIDYLLENHMYSTQVVAGLNYKYTFVANEKEHVVVIWKKLNNSFEVSLIDSVDSQ